MFELFKSKPFHDSELGKLHRSGGRWKGRIVLPPGDFRLSLAGGRNAPRERAIELARELRDRFPTLVSQIQDGLFQHYLPYKEAVEAGELPDSTRQQIVSASDVWSHVKPAHVLIEPFEGQDVEVAFSTEWDIEHTVAAIFSDWQLIELNGSVRGI